MHEERAYDAGVHVNVDGHTFYSLGAPVTVGRHGDGTARVRTAGDLVFVVHDR